MTQIGPTLTDAEPVVPSFRSVVRQRLRARPDMLAGMALLTIGFVAIMWIAGSPLGLFCQILLATVGLVPNVLVILGMVYDYADVDVNPGDRPVSAESAAHSAAK